MSDFPALSIDVGNSRVKVGLFDVWSTEPLPAPTCHAAFPVGIADPAATIGRWLDEQGGRPAAAFVGGVNPRVVAAIREGWRPDRGRIAVIGRPHRALLANRTDEPDRVGPDRLFDAVATNRLRTPGTTAVIVGAGTATTVNLVDDAGFRGGAILAGFQMIAAALHERTALLPRIDAADLIPPPEPLGRNTADALRAGLYWGLVGAVRELVARYTSAVSAADGRAPLLLLTGGAAPLLAAHLPDARHEPYLTLQGLLLTAAFDPSAR